MCGEVSTLVWTSSILTDGARSARFHADVEFAWTATLFGGASAASEAFPPCDQGMADFGKRNSFAHAKRTFLYEFCQNFYMPIKLRSLSSAFSRFQKNFDIPTWNGGKF